MPVIVFLMDTSPSMGQKVYIGGAGVYKTYLDVAKETVELFIQLRSRHCPDSVKDRYILLTFDEKPSNVKSGWFEHCHFLKYQLKNLQCNGSTTLTDGLKNTYDFLNLFRKQYNMDTYGFGWRPFHTDPTTIILITDGGCVKSYVAEEQVTKQFFRWDQRIFTIVLRIPAHCIEDFDRDNLERDVSIFESLSAETGGRSYKILSQKMIQMSFFNILIEMRSNVSVRLEVSSHNEIMKSQSILKIRTVRETNNETNGNWPLPESYSIKPTTTQLYEREAHPKLLINPKFINIPNLLMCKEFPMDEYPIQDCFLTEQFRSHANYKMNQCWQVSMRCDVCERGTVDIGYLRIAPNGEKVNLYVLPYNYPELLSLISELIKNHICHTLIKKFKKYLSTMPAYYRPYLRRAFDKLNVPINELHELLPDSDGGLLPAHIIKLLENTKMVAREAFNCFNTNVHNLLKRPIPPKTCQNIPLDTSFTKCEKLIAHPMVRETFTDLHNEADSCHLDINSTKCPELYGKQTSQCFPKNPYEMARRDLVKNVAFLRQAFLHPNKTPINNINHSMSIAQMGNYQMIMRYDEKFKLKDLWPMPPRRNIFGNPYKEQNYMMIVDETDNIDELNSNTKCGSNKEVTPKKKNLRKGPISPEFSYTKFMRRLSVDSNDDVDGDDDIKNGSTLLNLSPYIENKQLSFHSSVNASFNSSSKENQHNKSTKVIGNITLRTQIFRCIRRPGRDYTQLFQKLSYLIGDQSKFSSFIDDCLKESDRFRRRHMKQCIEQWWNQKQQQMKIQF